MFDEYFEFFEIFFLRGHNYELSLAYGHGTLYSLLGTPEWTL